MNKAILLLALLLLASASYAIYARRSNGEIRLPITAEEALSIVEQDTDAIAFIEENFFNESERLTNIVLRWDQDTNSYTWEVYMTERECGCRGLEGMNVLEAKVDPSSGEIIDLSTRVAVSEEVLARETCMKGCH